MSAENNPVVDSLNAVIEATENDTTKVDLLIALSEEFKDNDKVKAIEILNSAMKFAKTANSKIRQASILRAMGSVYIGQADLDKATQVLFSSIKISEDIKEWEGAASAYILLGRLHMEKGLDDNASKNALKYFIKSLDALEKAGNKKRIAAVLNNIGTAYGSMNDYSTAIVYLLKSLKIREEIKDDAGIASTLSNIGLIYSHQNDYDKALVYQMKSLVIRERIGDKKMIANSLNNIGDVYAAKGDYDKAIEWLKKGLESALETGNKYFEKNSYNGLTEVYEAKNDFANALIYARKYEELKDMMLNAESDEQIQELETKYETEKKEKTIQNLTKEQLAKETEIVRRRTVNTFVLIGASVIALVLLFTYRTYRQKQEANELLTKLDKEKNEFLGIAAHDLKNPLQTIIGYCQMQTSYFDKLSKEKILKQTNNIEITSARMLDLVSNLLDINAIEEGLIKVNKEKTALLPLLEKITDGIENQASHKGIKVHLETTEKNIEVITDALLLRQIIENLLSNGIKYSPESSEVVLRCAKTNGRIEIAIIDSGPGIPVDEQELLFKKFSRLSTRPTAGESSHGLGLSIVKKLSDLLSIEVSFESEQGKGSTFKLLLP
ncbi:MAG: tetratricopeptide repeat-containing sensor histidine kinase [Bacteroidia bacterium]|nr:tetratricopeptide repeat-containing sensor histidine kinase [Bacteroidia bacterium]MBP9178936.1 tetratricopeptide repeat-containing sensor histidine kinase [Bacteroidia bacterium]MBP9723237.1 tetratricopeptide repeat-containing sensor histidine kinase [Bacteroidia bacterium]